MKKIITGIHHVTALSSSAQGNIDFYTGILGLRMVKKTVNFDAPDVYHLYYGNETGEPGTIMTFFPFPGLMRGRPGIGQQTVTSFSIPAGSVDYWLKRLKKFNITHKEPQERLDNEVFIQLEDPDGLLLELVATDKDARPGFSYGQIPLKHAIKGFFGVTLTLEGYERTAGLLTTLLDHHLITEKGNRFRYGPDEEPGKMIDLVCNPDLMRGLSGSGTIHHLAFATPDDETQLEVREKLLKHHHNVTPVLDRQYFHSIYFREPGGVLFEVATNTPGFEIDEPADQLGTNLKLPSWEERNRKLIQANLVPVELKPEKYQD